MILDPILARFSNDLAIDLGTANTLVYVRGEALYSVNPQW
jgi:rod shape-determining protein MreB